MPYRVTGVLVDEGSGDPLAGLVVRAYDKDLVFDDHLGDARTDAQGRFEIVFTEAQFQDFVETQPDVYVRVYDASGGKLLLTTRRDARVDTRTDEYFEIRVPRTAP